MGRWLIGTDTGGTFTDLIAFDSEAGEIRCAKVPSRADDPSLAVLAALDEVLATGIKASDIVGFAHGTTVATNALLEGNGARTGMIVTRGFRAVYHGRGWSQPTGADVIDPHYRKPPPLVPLRYTEEVTERIGADGEIVVPLAEEDVRAAVRRLAAQGMEAVAVCFLFSFLRPDHERRAAEIIAEEAPGLRISLSSSVLPVVREYIRLSTTVVDAYVGIAVETYLARLDQRLKQRGLRTPRLYTMQSNGGLTPIATAGHHAGQLLLSGPAAGLIAAAELARSVDRRNVVTFDMGGTSADIGLVVDGQVKEGTGGVLVGQDVGTPMLQVRTLSAGGGTIAWIGKDGLLKVGPSSAGSNPGPACYGLGGEAPTVTDANVVLGVLGSGTLAGNLRLDAEKARAAIETHVARPFGLDVVAAADGIRRIINTAMAVDVRLALQEAGQDPRRFSLMAFGGAGALHACEIAQSCGIPEVIVPLRPGLNCAMGLLQTSVRHSYLRSRLGRLSTFPAASLEETFRGLAAEAMTEARAEGFEAHEVRLTRLIEMRYPNQGYQLAVPCPSPFVEADRSRLKSAFDTLHRRTYGQAAKTADAELVTFRLLSEIAVPRLALPLLPDRDGNSDRALIGERKLYDSAARDFVDAKVYDRDLFAPRDIVMGPAIINQLDATTLLLAGQRLEVAPHGALIIAIEVPNGDAQGRCSSNAGAAR